MRNTQSSLIPRPQTSSTFLMICADSRSAYFCIIIIIIIVIVIVIVIVVLVHVVVVVVVIVNIIIQRVLDLAAEKGSSVWLTVLPLHEMDFNLSKGEFRDAIKLRYHWPVDDIPSTCVCGDIFTIDHAMIWKRGGFFTQRHNELGDLEADVVMMLRLSPSFKTSPENS